MRLSLCLTLWLIATIGCVAQQQDKTLSQRLSSVMTEGLDQKQVNSMSYKKFEGAPGLELKKSQQQNDFAGTKEFTAKNYTTRSFFGVKNPWFGNKVFETKTDKDWSKKALSDAKKNYAVDAAETREFAQAGKSAGLTDTPVETRKTEMRGSTQGALDASTKKNLSIDEVREILNKNH